MSNYKTVFFIIGVLQIILGIFMAIPIIIQLVFSELDSSFIASSVITLVFGVLFVLSNLDYNKKINLQQGQRKIPRRLESIPPGMVFEVKFRRP